jgi:ribosomal protein S20
VELAEIAGKEKEEEEKTFEKTSSVIDRDAKKRVVEGRRVRREESGRGERSRFEMFENGKGKEKWY